MRRSPRRSGRSWQGTSCETTTVRVSVSRAVRTVKWKESNRSCRLLSVQPVASRGAPLSEQLSRHALHARRQSGVDPLWQATQLVRDHARVVHGVVYLILSMIFVS